MKYFVYFWSFVFFCSYPIHEADSRRRPEAYFKSELSDRGQKFLLFSQTLKLATIFRIRVYGVGLYLPSRKIASSKLLKTSFTKIIVLHFLRHISAEELSKSWLEDLKSTCDFNCESLLKQVKQKTKLLPDIKRDDRMKYRLEKNNLHLSINDKFILNLKVEGISRAVLGAFIGPKAPEDIREALLKTE